MTFSQRRRFIRLFWVFASHWFLPYFLGSTIPLISITYFVTEASLSLDKAGFGLCSKTDKGQGVGQLINLPKLTWI